MSMRAEAVRIPKVSPDYPATLRKCLGDDAPDALWTLGNRDLLRQQAVALFCSVKCPGNLILKTYDLVRELRDAGVAVISGFHSPMEKECLDLLLRGTQPVIACPARRLSTTRLPAYLRSAVSEGRLLMLSPFGGRVKRPTEATASFRNAFVAALADKVFVAYAAQRSKTENLCRKVLEWGKPLLTFDSSENNSLIALGATPCGSATLVAQGYVRTSEAAQTVLPS